MKVWSVVDTFIVHSLALDEHREGIGEEVVEKGKKSTNGTVGIGVDHSTSLSTLDSKKGLAVSICT